MDLRIALTCLIALGGAGCNGTVMKADFERIQGKWDAVSIHKDGAVVATDGQGYEFAAGHMIKIKDGVVEGPYGTYRLDDKKQPKWLDIHDEKRNLDLRAIYELDDDNLRICLNERGTTDADRPTEFKSVFASPNQVLLVFARRK